MSKSLEKFKSRYYTYKDNPSVTAISLQGVKLTKEVKEFIKKHHMQIKAESAYYPKNKKLRREGAQFMVSGKKKKKGVRGY